MKNPPWNWKDVILLRHLGNNEVNLIWDKNLSAPIEIIYAKDYKEFYLDYNLSRVEVECVAGFTSIVGKNIIANNKAGINGETLTLEEILELYK